MNSDVDARLIEALRQNGRATIRALAQELEVPETTVRDHLRRLETNGRVEGYRPVVDLTALNVHQAAWIIGSVPEDIRTDALRQMAAHPQVVAAHALSSDAARVAIHVVAWEKRRLVDFVDHAANLHDLDVIDFLPVEDVLQTNAHEALPDVTR